MEVLGRISAAIRSRSAWRVTYRQEYVPAGMRSGETVSGTLTLAWPDRALFITGDPPVRLMGMEGRKVRLVDLETESCEDHVLTDREWERIPLVALLDPSRAMERFTLLLEDGGLALVPRETQGIARVIVRSGPSGLPDAVTIEDLSGAVNRFDFWGWEPAQAPRGGWLPAPPNGVPCLADDR